MPKTLISIAGAGLLVAAAAHGQFRDVAAEVGIDTPHVIAPICNPPLSTGNAFADVDGDGDLDLFLTNHGGANQLYVNQGDLDGDGLPDFVDRAAELGVDDPDGIGLGAVFVDFDDDGDQDLYSLRYEGNAFYRNELVEGGGLAFTEIAGEIGLVDGGRPITAAWGDYDGDGRLDVYVTKHGWCSGTPGDNQDVLFRSLPDRTFEDASDLLCDGPAPCDRLTGTGFAPGWFDYDNDGDLDLYLVNDDLGPEFHHNVLWRNDGPDGAGGWLFTDVSAASGTDVSLNGMGLGIGDIDNDGWLDIAFSNGGKNWMMRNQGDGTFVDVSGQAGTERATLPNGDKSITWGTVFFDLDNDGLVDLFYAAGYTADPPFDQPNALFRNDGDGTFSDISAAYGVDDEGRGRSAAVGDVDGDGFVDLFVGNFGQMPLLYRNEEPDFGNPSHWLKVTVEGVHSNRDGIGTRLRLETAGVRGVQSREITSGATHGGGDEKAAYFGLGADTGARLTVRWPDNAAEQLLVGEVDRTLHLVEPSFRLAEREVTGGRTAGSVELVVTGAAPGAELRLVAAFEPGMVGLPGCAGVPVSLAKPHVLGIGTADGAGTASFTVDAPSGGASYYQVVDGAACTVTNRIRAVAP